MREVTFVNLAIFCLAALAGWGRLGSELKCLGKACLEANRPGPNKHAN